MGIIKPLDELNNPMGGGEPNPYLEITYGNGMIRCEGDIKQIGGFQFDYKVSGKEDVFFRWNFADRMDKEVFVKEGRRRKRVIVYNINRLISLPKIWCDYTGQLAISQESFLISSFALKGRFPRLLEYRLIVKSDEFPKTTGRKINEQTKPLNQMTNKVRS